MRFDALVHAGGKGSRMGHREKAMLLVDDTPMIDHVLAALRGCGRIERILVTVSGNTPRTKEHLLEKGIDVQDTSGDDYVGDLHAGLRELRTDSVLVCPADLPMIDSVALEAFLDAYGSDPAESFQVAVPASAVREAGMEPSYTFEEGGEELALCAVSVVDREAVLEGRALEVGTYRTEDLRFALNVNTPADLEGLRPWTGASRSSSRSPPPASRR